MPSIAISVVVFPDHDRGRGDGSLLCLSPQAAIRNEDFGLGRVHVSSLRGIVLQLRDAAPALLVRATEALGLDGDFTATEWK